MMCGAFCQRAAVSRFRLSRARRVMIAQYDLAGVLDIQQGREWHETREPGLGDQFLQRVNETMTRSVRIPTSTRS